MAYNLIDKYIKCKMDLEAVSTLLNKIYEREKDSLQSHANYKSPIGKSMYEKEEKQFSALTKCKENLDFVINVLKEYINQNKQEYNSMLSYQPRKFTCSSELCEYKRELVNAKRIFKDSLSWMPSLSFTRDEKKVALYQDCINRLDYIHEYISEKVY